MGSYSGIPQNNWVDRLQSLADVDWSQQNTALWEGRAMIRGKMSKAQDSIKLTANAIKQLLELARTEESQKLRAKAAFIAFWMEHSHGIHCHSAIPKPVLPGTGHSRLEGAFFVHEVLVGDWTIRHPI
jgi:hypothetical protein